MAALLQCCCHLHIRFPALAYAPDTWCSLQLAGGARGGVGRTVAALLQRHGGSAGLGLPALTNAPESWCALCRSLAVRAAALGAPWLLSFSGMAAVLGWPPRAPLVAECDRGRVLRSWAPACGRREPRLRMVPFAAVRGLPPAEFVRVLAEDLQVLLALGCSILLILNHADE